MKNLFLSLFITLTASFAHAVGGSGAGNGGDVLVCESTPAQPAVQLLDFFEIGFYDKSTPHWSATATTPESLVAALIADLKKVSPLRAELYERHLNGFMGRVQFVDHPLVDIPDSQHLLLPKECHVEQLAIQYRQGVLPNYEINRALWNRLDVYNRAGLILHEIIYSEALAVGHQNSIGARSFLRFLLRNEDWKNKRFAVLEATHQLELYLFMEITFKNGESARFYHNSLSRWQRKPNEFYSNFEYLEATRSSYTLRHVCSARLKDGTSIDVCRKGLSLTIETVGGESIGSLREELAAQPAVVHYSTEGDAVGLPFPIISYDLDNRRPIFVPKEDVFISNPWFQGTCAGGGYVIYPHRSDRISRFDLSAMQIETCEVKGPAKLNVGGTWIQFANLGRRNLITYEKIPLEKSFRFKVLDQWIMPNEVSLYESSAATLKLSKPTPFKVLNTTVMLGPRKERERYEYANDPDITMRSNKGVIETKISFQGTTKLRIAGHDFIVESLEFKAGKLDHFCVHDTDQSARKNPKLFAPVDRDDGCYWGQRNKHGEFQSYSGQLFLR